MERKNEYSASCGDSHSWQTGSTQPKKPRRGLLTVLLIGVIFLGGIASALGIMNAQLFQQITGGPDNAPVQFSAADPDEETLSSGPLEQTQAPELDMTISSSPASVENIPQEGGLSLQQIYVKAAGSVVSISCTGYNGVSTGSGVILSSDGYIITNAHVVDGAVSIEAALYSGESYSARLVGADPVTDLAVLHIDAQALTPAEFGDSGALRVGDTVVAIGDPLGMELQGTMTDGIVSAINRDLNVDGRTMTLIQTNAALNAGNSGGPLLNCYGQVVGINTMKIGDYMSTAGVEGLGFAIPSSTVKEVADQLVRQGYIAGRPSLGIRGETVSSFARLYYRLPQGIFITQIVPGTDAENRDIRPGDILLSIDGLRIADTDSLVTLMAGYTPGDQVTLTIYRAGKELEVPLILAQVQE